MKIMQGGIGLLLFMMVLGIGAFLEGGVAWVSPADFHPADGYTFYWVSNSINGDFWQDGNYLCLTSGGCCFSNFVARVYLPNGVTIKKVTLYVSHSSANPDDALKIQLYRVKPVDGTGGNLAYINSSGLPDYTDRTAMVASNLYYKTINTNVYAYWAWLSFYDTCTTACKFFGLKIEY